MMTIKYGQDGYLTVRGRRIALRDFVRSFESYCQAMELGDCSEFEGLKSDYYEARRRLLQFSIFICGADEQILGLRIPIDDYDMAIGRLKAAGFKCNDCKEPPDDVFGTTHMCVWFEGSQERQLARELFQEPLTEKLAKGTNDGECNER